MQSPRQQKNCCPSARPSCCPCTDRREGLVPCAIEKMCPAAVIPQQHEKLPATVGHRDADVVPRERAVSSAAVAASRARPKLRLRWVRRPGIGSSFSVEKSTDRTHGLLRLFFHDPVSGA